MLNSVIKVSELTLDAIKKHKKKHGLVKYLRVKGSQKFDNQFESCRQNLGQVNGWLIKKIDSVSVFGDMRMIFAKKQLEGGEQKVICFFYFKNEQKDLNKINNDEIAKFLSNCNDSSYYESLVDLDSLE
jgi:hypothetical protein